MSISSFLRPLILLSILAAAGVTDAAFHKIYNSLTLTGFILILATHIIEPPGIDPVSLCCSVCFLLILFVFFSLKMLGGGDVKLYLLTVFAYPDGTGWRILALSVISAALTLVLCILKNCFVTRAHKTALPAGAPDTVPSRGRAMGTDTVKLPMAVFIFAASCPVLLAA